jgi:hypothetical protein
VLAWLQQQKAELAELERLQDQLLAQSKAGAGGLLGWL